MITRVAEHLIGPVFSERITGERLLADERVLAIGLPREAASSPNGRGASSLTLPVLGEPTPPGRNSRASLFLLPWPCWGHSSWNVGGDRRQKERAQE